MLLEFTECDTCWLSYDIYFIQNRCYQLKFSQINVIIIAVATAVAVFDAGLVELLLLLMLLFWETLVALLADVGFHLECILVDNLFLHLQSVFL